MNPMPRLPRPERAVEQSFWIDEAIWGHRLHDEQGPWLVLMELFGVLRAEHAAGRAFKEPDGPNTLRYSTSHRLHLRNILFNNPTAETILADQPDDRARWARWHKAMLESASGIDPVDFSYLERRFASFDDFVHMVQLLRTTAIEGDSNKRWSSKFVFPYGPDCLYEDLRVDDRGNASNDRRFFGRTGEIAYLMLCRSNLGSELLSRLEPLVLDRSKKWNLLVAALQPDPETLDARPRTTSGSYLPYSQAPEFVQLAEDWLTLLRARLPGYDVLPHLVDLLGLNLLLYFLRRAAEWKGTDRPKMVLEIVAPKRTTVRDLAAETFVQNGLLSREAIEAFIQKELVSSPEWRSACASEDPFLEAKTVAHDKVRWKDLDPDGGQYEGPTDPQGLLGRLREQAAKRHEQHVSGVHPAYARAIGLASRRGTRRLRYAPSDHFLKSIVLAVVPKRLEFQAFLELLWNRYSFVIGHRQATALIGQGISDQRAFEENARRLEQRLASLGLLRRLSDACAYVENPFGGGAR